ncbi:thiol peroxidase [Fluviicola chungangensis]|uniref:Thiol peroxidase n=1 Tax=Fluviicola chungangensis TaxID=2597671 RepID=A0A556MJV9_9FLAO|nr:thiol peroxidase [Fluviicola chungangensis]TSJ40162.1 thiol peroxidase [Fluviicola chungangensis]
MANVTLGGNPLHTSGDLPAKGSQAADFSLVNTDLGAVSLDNYKGKKLILNIFPSIDTGTCAASVREFNKKASTLENTTVLCISRDLPFAQKRFCGAEGIENVVTLSDFRDGEFGKNYGLELLDGPLQGLHARSVVVLDEDHKVVYTELVPDIKDEPNYEKALAAL